MFHLIVALGFAVLSRAEVLEVTDVQYIRPAESASCGLLKHREQERRKVIRELEYLNKLGARGVDRALLLTGNLITNKLFMPREQWIDLVAEVHVTARLPASLVGVPLDPEKAYFSVRGPGMVWESHLYQLPDDLTLAIDSAAGLMHIRYLTYLNIICLGRLYQPQVELFSRLE